MTIAREAAQAEAARAAAGGGVYHFGAANGGGYAFTGRPPVLAEPRTPLLPPVTLEQQRDAWIARSMRQGRRISQLEAEVERLESVIRQWEAGEL
jgi:hypothetical protein